MRSISAPLLTAVLSWRHEIIIYSSDQSDCTVFIIMTLPRLFLIVFILFIQQLIFVPASSSSVSIASLDKNINHLNGGKMDSRLFRGADSLTEGIFTSDAGNPSSLFSTI